MVMAIASFALLFPGPFESQERIAAYYKQQQIELSSHLEEMKVSAVELEKSLAFSVTRQQREVWLRWVASFLFFVLISASTWGYAKAQAVIAKTGLSVAAVIYLVMWIFAVILLGDPSRATILDAFIGRILNELAVGNPLVFARFMLLYAVTPIACLVVLFFNDKAS